jgi:eukaryotic-like serine/threonine-protein kinase
MIETLGQYKILEPVEPVGRGLADPASASLGDVFRARDTRVGRTVAITIVADRIASDPVAREQFLRAAHAAAAVSHPNIVTLYEVGEDEGRLYLVHEFIQGQALGSIIAGRPLHPRRAVDLASQIAEGLSDAHAADLMHGHITADNIIVTPKGSAKIAGFGVAAWALAALPSAQPGAQGDGADGEACRADLAALGALLFEMLTARRPSPGAGVPSAVNRSLPRDIDPIVARALGKSGGYESAVTLAAELRAVGAILEVRQEASEAAVSVGAARRKRTYSKWVILALVVGVLTAIALAAIWLGAGYLFSRA